MANCLRYLALWFLILFFAFHTSAAYSQTNSGKPTSFWPDGVEYDSNVPTPKSFFGFDIGFRHLDHSQVASYVRTLANASDRISIQQYATTHGGRPNLLLTITSAKNRSRLEQIRKSHRLLTKKNADKVDTRDLPVVINMGYGVHGDESSATNSAPLVAYYLAAAKGKEIEGWLDSCVILLDPSLNPDGFNRFAHWANRYRGRVLNADPQHAEHNQQWPPGRVNYYWFDLNRDWLPLVHPESRGRMRWYHQWKPNVVLDFHEMGTNSTYFFQPGIPQRTNPMTPARNQELTRKFGEYHAKALDKKGSLYFTKERFDDFYMGKGSTYPDLHGSVGILFEQASSRGHLQRNQDGLLRFHDTIANQFTTSLSSLRATTAMRGELLNFKKSFYEQAFEMAEKQATQTYFFTSPGNRSRLVEFATTLKRHDIQSYWLKEDLEYGDVDFESDFTLVVPAAQAEYRFLRSLLMTQTNFKENIFYDVSSWTLPLAYGLNQTSSKRKIEASKLELFKLNPVQKRSEFQFDAEAVAYIVDYRDDQAVPLLAKLLKRNVNLRVSKKPVTVQSGGERVKLGYGAISIPLKRQMEKIKFIEASLKEAAEKGVDIFPVHSGLALSGPDLGSSTNPVVKKPSIAMLTGPGTSAYTTGEVWHLFDTQVGLPVTLLKSSQFARADLSDYTTLILAGARLDDQEWETIEAFANSGGTVIAVGSTAVSVQRKLGTNVSPSTDSEPNSEIQKPFDSSAAERALQLISGAIFKTKADLTHPLLYGFTENQIAVFRNHSGFLTPSRNPYANPLVYVQNNPLMAGYCSPENVEKFKGSASVVVAGKGRGRFILLADNPNFRGFWKGTNRLLVNAVFFGEETGP